MRPAPVVVLDVLRQQPLKVTLIQDHDVVQALAAKGPHHALGDPVRLWTAERAEDRVYANRSRPGQEALAEAGVTVTEEETRLFTPGRRLDELTPYPVGRWMGGDVHVQKSPPTVLDEEEYVEGSEGERRHGEEVTSPDVRSVVSQEGAPGLGRRSAASLVHVPSDRFAADLVAKAEEFAADALGAPERILQRHSEDQVSDFGSDPRPSA